MYVFGSYPSPLPGNLFSCPMCADVDGVVVVDVPVFVYPADDGMEVRYAAVRFPVQPHAGFAARYVGRHGNDLAVLIQNFLIVESRREVVPQLLPVLDREIFGMFHRRTYLQADDVVLDVRAVHGGEFHFRPDARSVHALQYKVVADARYLFGMFLVPRFPRHVQHRPDAVANGFCLGYHTASSSVSPSVVPAG